MRKRLRGARSYACYYGEGRLETLILYDAAILQPSKYAGRELAGLAANGTISLAYLSLGEDEGGAEAPWAKLGPDGAALRNPLWGSVVVDPAHPAWRKTVLERAGLALARGFSGLFLDTLDAEGASERRALARLVRDLRARFPAAPIVMNRGFSVLPSVQDAVDGVLFESLSTTWRLEGEAVTYGPVDGAAREANREAARAVTEIAARWELARFALDYADTEALEAEAAREARALGFVPYCSDRTLTRLD